MSICQSDTPRAVEVILFARFYPWWHAVAPAKKKAYPVLSAWIDGWAKHPAIADGLALFADKVKIAPPKIIADASHRKINTQYTINLKQDKIK
jgi:hypothetical protein